MSIDSYFCLCCMSTDNLFSLFDKKHGFSYTESLKSLFGIILSEQDYDDDYICLECTQRLKDLNHFKQQVFKSINTLQVFGLIKIAKFEGNTIIHKIKVTSEKNLHDIDEEKVTLKAVQSEEYKPEVRVTVQQIKSNTLTNVSVSKNSDIIHSFLANDAVRKLEKDNNISKTLPDKDNKLSQDLKCMICMETLPNSYTFNTHMNKHFPNYVCEECGRSFMSEKRLKRHRYCHKSGPFVCPDCGVKFNKYSTFSSHRKYGHSTPPVFTCQHCPAQFPTLSQRNRHAFVTHDDGPKYKCVLCGASFITSGLLTTHMKYKHQKLKRYFCDICKVGFFHKVELIGHTASHSGVNPYKCDRCSKSYLRKKALAVHMKLHSDDKRFCCDVCGRRFLQKCTLITHLKVHSRLKKNKEQKQMTLHNDELKTHDGNVKVHTRSVIDSVIADQAN